MSPRAYNLGEREAATAETRARIIDAARELLSSPEGINGFTIEAVARLAGVARMTVYYQFASKQGLLEALYDNLGQRSLVPHLARVMAESDPLGSLMALVGAFSNFWGAELLVTRRLRALAKLDADVEQGIRQRDQWRRRHLTNLLGRLAKAEDRPHKEETVDLIFAATSFETFDTLAGLKDAATAKTLVQDLVAAILKADQPVEWQLLAKPSAPPND